MEQIDTEFMSDAEFEKKIISRLYKNDIEVLTSGIKIEASETKIELLESTEADGVIAKFIEKRGEGLHHIAFEVPDILAEMERLKKEGFTLLNEAPKMGADNKWVCFVHPKDAGGVLIEICQTKK
jgi:methylmalonyl-CoA/ethylmalonyl-CoA epimerase